MQSNSGQRKKKREHGPTLEEGRTGARSVVTGIHCPSRGPELDRQFSIERLTEDPAPYC